MRREVSYRDLHTFIGILERSRVDESTLGVLFSYAVSAINQDDSPGALAHKNPQHPLEEAQKRCQSYLRGFFREKATKVFLGQTRIEELADSYVDGQNSFAQNSVEEMVLLLAVEDRFEDIGKAVKEGATAYHQKAERKGMTNYRFAAEYEAIRDELKDLLKRT